MVSMLCRLIEYDIRCSLGVATSPAEFSGNLPIYRKANLAVLTFHEVKFVEVEANLERRLRSTKTKRVKKKSKKKKGNLGRIGIAGALLVSDLFFQSRFELTTDDL